MKKTRIKVIVFDNDSTLTDFITVMRHSQAIVLEELERHRSGTTATMTVDRMIQIRDRTVTDPEYAKATFEEIRLESFRRIVAATGEPDESLAAHCYQLYMKHRYEDLDFYEDVLPTLTILKEKYTLGMHSNGNTYPDRCGLDRYFTFSVFPRDCGFQKPEPGFYRAVIERAGCKPDEILSVGDSFHSDVEAAEQAGMQGVWLNRNFQTPPSHTGTINEIHSLAELPELLG